MSRALRRRRWLALGLVLAVLGPVVAYTLSLDPRYESTGTVWLEERTLNLFPEPGQRAHLPVLLTVLQSRNLAANVVDALPRRAYEELVRQRLSIDWPTALTNQVRRLRGAAEIAVSPREQVISELLKARMTFTPKDRTSGIVQVTATASDPIIAADIATAYVETLQSRTRVFTREESRAVREFLGTQAKQVGATLQEAEEALVQFERRRGYVQIDDRIKTSLDNLNQAESSLSGSILSEEIARTRLAAVKAQLEGRPAGKKVTESIVVPPALRSLYERWQATETKVAALTRRYTDAHPQVRAAKEEIQELGPRLSEALRQHLKITVAPDLPPAERSLLIDQVLTLAEEIGRVQEERERYGAQARALRASLDTLSQDQKEIARRRQAVETNKSLHDLLTRKTEEANIRFQGDLRNIRILDPPGVPLLPSGRQPLNFLLVGLAAALAAAVGLPLGLEMLDSTIKTEEEAEALLGWPVLGSILSMEPRTGLVNGERARALPPAPVSGRGRKA